MEKPVRKRGRPPITKDYANPLESPMAHSSLKMQKQGAHVFQRPTMKVGSVTPSPKNRSFSNPNSSNGSSSSSESIVSECGSQPGSSKKPRYRGVILSTPTKWPAGGRQDGAPGSSGTVTPLSDNVFCSTSRLALRSSPPTTSPIKDGYDGGDNINRNVAKVAGPDSRNSPSQQFKFSLTIGENGRASIAGSNSSPETTPCKSNYSQQYNTNNDPNARTSINNSSTSNASIDTSTDTTANKNNNNNNDSDGKDDKGDLSLQTFGRRKVLTLLKQMRNEATTASPSVVSMVRKPAHKHEIRNSLSEIELPPILEACVSVDPNPNTDAHGKPPNGLAIWNQPSQPPSTPKTSFSIRTGFTPNIGIDQVLLDVVASPKGAGPRAEECQNIDPTGDSPENPLNYNYLNLSPRIKLQESSQQGQVRPQQEEAQQQREQKQRTQNQQQFVFKFSSADPLLLTDEADGNWSEVIYNHFQNSPRPQTCFNTPPSWINFGSPRAPTTSFTPQQRGDPSSLPQNAATENDTNGSLKVPSHISQTNNGNLASISSSPPRRETFPPSPFRCSSLPHGATLMPRVITNNTMIMTGNNSNDRLVPEPSTPKDQEVQLPAMIECTPLIQQTMSGSITTRYLSNVLSTTANYDAGINGLNSSSGPLAEQPLARESMGQSFSLGGEQEDARAALKKLIAER